MAIMARKLGQIEAAALAYVQMRNLRSVKTGDLAAALRITGKQERELLSRMARAGMIANVRKGLYLFPTKLPLGGIWTPDEAIAINALMADKQARYQITGPNAFNRYGYDEQIPSRIYIYNAAISGERTVGRIELTLIKVNQERLGGTEQIETASGETTVYSSRVRTLVDAVYDWSRFDSLPRAYDWIRTDIDAGRITTADLAKTTIRYGNLGTIRRIGALMEQINIGEPVLKRLQRALTPSSAKIPFLPDRPARGRLMKRWGVVIND
jgi:predicted transcriptional regulator of viral defense system